MDKETFRQIMRAVPCPVGVVVAESGDGELRGMTASSFSSVSLTPPLVSLNVTVGSTMHGVLDEASSFTFNLLASDQAELASHFARSGVPTRQQMEAIVVQRMPSGAVLLPACAAYVHCRTRFRYEVGDHLLLVGEVIEGSAEPDASPMVFFRGGFHAPST